MASLRETDLFYTHIQYYDCLPILNTAVRASKGVPAVLTLNRFGRRSRSRSHRLIEHSPTSLVSVPRVAKAPLEERGLFRFLCLVGGVGRRAVRI